MPADLTAWLRATIEGDKAKAEAVADGSAPWVGRWEAEGNVALRTYNGHVLAHLRGIPFKAGLLDHIALHDPRDTIARCEAELELLDLHKPGEYGECVTCHVGAQSCGCCGWGDFPCDTVQLLARGYRHRPGFKPSWLD